MTARLRSSALLFLVASLAGCGETVIPPTDCQPEKTRCSGACVDLQVDPSHCGSCDRACAEGQSCERGKCSGCQDECEAGRVRCADGAAALQTCLAGEDRCLTWSAAEPCGSNERCEDGACIPGCQDECPESGARECSGAGVRECGEHDEDACLEWSTVTDCPARHTCVEGACVAVCEDECPGLGARECVGEGTRVCGEHDEDECLEWSAVTACGERERCDPQTATCRPLCGDHCDPFSIVLLPDTQYYTSKQADNPSNTYYKQMQWILDHRDDYGIRFVIHLGDVTNNNTVAQWAIADKAHAMLDAAGMSYSMAPGNHDYLNDGVFSRGGTRFGDYFGPERFAGKPWYGGSMDANNLNNYTYFEVGPYRFMVLSLEYSPRKQTLCWAESLIASHPDHRVVIATHCYLTRGGGYSTGCPDGDYNVPGADGGTVWRELARRHSNVFLVVSGHIGDSEYVLAQGNNGNFVHQMLVDYQFEVPCSASSAGACNDHCRSSGYTGNGWLRRLVFSPADEKVFASTTSVEAGNTAVFPGGEPTLFCSPLNAQGQSPYGADPQGPDHQFSFDYALTDPVFYQRDDAGLLGFNDLTVNSAGAGNQLVPRVALSPDGAFTVVWQDNSSSADGDGNHDIMVRGFAPGGCERFDDLVVNPTTSGHQKSPSIGADDNGNFVVAWADDRDGNGVFQIYARGFNADGTQRFAERAVNSVAAGQQLNPRVAMAPDGRFVVAWEDDQDNDGNFQIYLRGFNPDGTQRFADLQVNTNSAGQHLAPSLATDSQARVVVAWQDDSDANDSYQIHGRGFAADGGQWLARFTVNSVSAGQQRKPSVGMDALGGFAVAWEDDADNNGKSQVMVRGFKPDGTERFADLAVSSPDAGEQLAVSLSMRPSGDFVVAWADDADGNGSHQLRARGFSSAGAQRFAERTINRDADGQQLAPDAALNDAGNLVFAWEDDMDGNNGFQILAKGLETSEL
ncbi:MAG TPA: hypothetical protein DFS52_01530 [Myxococcales bacterium]|nr:hypothetical protein [Myxococcales bacterium]